MKSWEVIMAAAALAAGIWSHVRTVLHWLRGFVVSTRWTDHDITSSLVSLLKTKRTVREPAYAMTSKYVRSLKSHKFVIMEEMIGSGGVLWFGRVPIKLTRHEKAKGGDVHDEYAANYTFEFIRGTLNWEDLLKQVADHKSNSNGLFRQVRYAVKYHHGRSLANEMTSSQRERLKNRTVKFESVFDQTSGLRLLHYAPEDIGGSLIPSSFKSLALSPEILDVVEEIKVWRKSRGWYQERGIAWRHGLLFHGAPGCGKTSLARATAEELDMPIHIFDLATMSNEDLREAWGEMTVDEPCIALIEDIDSVFNGRTNIATHGGMMSSGGLTFDALLNCVDGVERHEGVLFIITSNKPETIDPALKDRAGRIDRSVEFRPLDYEGRLKVAESILGKIPVAVELAFQNDNVAASRFVEICCKEALTALYGKTKKEPKGPYRD